jgi:hypothetical protein
MIKEQGFFRLSVPVPPMLEEAFGYPPGRALRPEETQPRFVAFYWTEGGDEASYSDGRRSGTGMLNNEAYLAFVCHPGVEPHLADYNLGASDAEASHWFVLDREERHLYVALAPAAERFLQRQWGDPPQKSAPLRVKDSAELEQLVANALNMHSWTEVTSVGSTADAMRALQEERQRTQDLQAWLNANA